MDTTDRQELGSCSREVSQKKLRKGARGFIAKMQHLLGRSRQPCFVCFNLDQSCSQLRGRWQINIRDDMTPEYFIDFEYSRLGLSARSGCTTCSVLLRGIELLGRNLSLFNATQVSGGRLIFQPSTPLEVEVFRTIEGDDIDCNFKALPKIQFYQQIGISDSSTPFSVARDVPSEMSVERCASIIATWISNCRRNHAACAAAGYEANRLPRRLLDVAGRDQRERARPTLVETGKHAICRKSHYATLSHCWGKTHIIQTTAENLKQRMSGIEWNELPRTFRDAIEIVRALNIRFIWIDSLCIVQDDERDWMDQSVRMAAIYSNSYINIAATGASDSRGGCLSPRTLNHTIPAYGVNSFPINIEPRSNVSVVFVRPSLDSTHHRYLTRSRYESDLPDSTAVPLLSRAWVFQERQLAPRTIHFHPSEMVMECRTGFNCECTGLDGKIPRTRRNSLQLNMLTQTQILDLWLNVVEEYSALRLTYNTDRLPALVGIATVFQKKLKCGYLAGIWREDIAKGLLWMVSKNGTEGWKTIRRNDSVPSWSWASLIFDAEGQKILFLAVHDKAFRIDSQFTFKSSDIPFAATESNLAPVPASISLCGASASATIYAHGYSEISSQVLLLIFDQEVEQYVVISLVEIEGDCSCEVSDFCLWKADVPAHCLLVGNTTDCDLGTGNEIQYHYVLVLREAGLGSQLFKRVGRVSVEKDLNLFRPRSEKVFKLI